RTKTRTAEAETETHRREARAAARPLPSESVRRNDRRSADVANGPESRGANNRGRLLRHGGRFWIRARALRHIDEDRRARRASRRTYGGAGRAHRRRWHQLPATNPPRCRARRRARRAHLGFGRRE